MFGIPPVILFIGLIILAVLFLTGFLAVIFAAKTLIVIALVGAGLILLVKPGILGAVGPAVKFGVPLFLIFLGLAFYSGWLKI